MIELFRDFNLTKGLNIGVSQYLNESGEARVAVGADLRQIGKLSRIPGYSSYGSGLDASAVRGLYDFKSVSGSVTKWLAKTGTKLYHDASGTWTDTGATLTSGEDATFATHLDTVIVGSESDAPLKSTNGTSFSSLGGSPPTAKYWMTFDNKVYALNTSSDPNQIRWSDDGTIETWTSTNVQSIATNIGIGDEITGGTVNNNTLLVFKNYSTWKWNASELRTMHANAGCRAPKSIVTIDDWTFWLSHKGVMATNGGKPFRISNPVRQYIEAITDITAPVGWAEDNLYFLYIGDVTVEGESLTDCLLIYNYDEQNWSVKLMSDAVNYAAILTTSGNARSSYFGNDAGQVYKFLDGNSDNGDPIPFEFATAPYMAGYPHLEKKFDYLYVFLDKTAKYGIDVYYSIDFKDYQKFEKQAIDAVSQLSFPKGTRGHNIRIKYATATTTEQRDILGHVCLGGIMPGLLGSVE